MTTTPWLNDTCSLVDAFRSGERSPVEEMEATLAAMLPPQNRRSTPNTHTQGHIRNVILPHSV